MGNLHPQPIVDGHHILSHCLSVDVGPVVEVTVFVRMKASSPRTLAWRTEGKVGSFRTPAVVFNATNTRIARAAVRKGTTTLNAEFNLHPAHTLSNSFSAISWVSATGAGIKERMRLTHMVGPTMPYTISSGIHTSASGNTGNVEVEVNDPDFVPLTEEDLRIYGTPSLFEDSPYSEMGAGEGDWEYDVDDIIEEDTYGLNLAKFEASEDTYSAWYMLVVAAGREEALRRQIEEVPQEALDRFGLTHFFVPEERYRIKNGQVRKKKFLQPYVFVKCSMHLGTYRFGMSLDSVYNWGGIPVDEGRYRKQKAFDGGIRPRHFQPAQVPNERIAQYINMYNRVPGASFAALEQRGLTGDAPSAEEAASFSVGSMVEFSGGSLVGMIGKVTALDARNKMLRVQVEVFGRMTAVEVGWDSACLVEP